jgi:hypothetical protein
MDRRVQLNLATGVSVKHNDDSTKLLYVEDYFRETG